MTLRPLEPDAPEFAAMIDALTMAGLPTSDVREDAAQFFMLGEADAFGGFATFGSAALLRSLVARDRGRGSGSALLQELLARLRGLHVRDVWLLTTSAEPFFAGHGFAKADRSAAPPTIAATSQFRDLCPATAALMHRHLS